jgi:hypothetical protein
MKGQGPLTNLQCFEYIKLVAMDVKVLGCDSELKIGEEPVTRIPSNNSAVVQYVLFVPNDCISEQGVPVQSQLMEPTSPLYTPQSCKLSAVNTIFKYCKSVIQENLI